MGVSPEIRGLMPEVGGRYPRTASPWYRYITDHGTVFILCWLPWSGIGIYPETSTL